jgi:hypothetical protein
MGLARNSGSFSLFGQRGAARRRQKSWNRPLETLENRQMLAAEPIVSEFMAINTTTLQDQDGDFSDWLELGNRGDVAIDLGGHYLTNDAADPDRWQIPAGTVLDPGEYMVVFASGKNRAIAGGQLHTNFMLHNGGAGSFLALVAPNGSTLVNSFTNYPVQTADHSYGRLRRSVATTFFDRGDPVSYLVPDAADDALIQNSWTGRTFVPGAAGETGWTNGNLAIGYETQVTSSGFAITYHKASGQIGNLAQADAVISGIGRSGTPITRVDPTINILNDAGVGNFGDDRPLPSGTAAVDDYALQAVGTIFISPADAGLWTFGINADDGTRVRIDGTTVINDDVQSAPHDALGQRTLTAGTHTVELTFFERGGGSEVEFFAAKGAHTAFENEFFRLVGDSAAGGIPTGGLDQIINTDIQTAMSGINSSAYVRIPFNVTSPADVLSAEIQFEYDDGYVAYLNGTEISRQNAPATTDYNSAAAANSALAVANLDLASHMNLLVAGQNVIAVHALNASSSDGEVYLNAELTGRTLQPEILIEFDEPTPGGLNGLLDPVISEFMALNNITLEDEDGDNSPWLEIFNPGDLEIELGGYHLTNDLADLDKWTLPDITLAPGDQVLIFASGKNRAVAGSELHTNFILSAADDSDLALTDSANAIVSQFANYPEQIDDISYGFEGSTFQETVLTQGAAAVALVPSAANPAVDNNWFTPSFDPSPVCATTSATNCWTSGTTGIGFETTPPGYQALFGLDLRSRMRVSTAADPRYMTAYIRVPFNVTDPALFQQLSLGMQYDDGFVAYLNGVKIAEANAPNPPAWNSLATAGHDDALAVSYQNFDITSYLNLLTPGQNVLAIHGMDLNNTSTDFLILPRMIGTGAAAISDTVRYFATPTPDLANGAGVLGFVGETQILKEHGFYTQPITVHINNNSPGLEGVEIWYTTNGDAPTPGAVGSIKYTGPITISGTTALRAAGFYPGYEPSKSVAQTYIFLSDVVTQTSTAAPPGWPANWGANTVNYGMDAAVVNSPEWGPLMQDALRAIPTWSIVMDLDDLFGAEGIYSNPGPSGRAWERPASFEVFDPQGREEGFTENGGIRIRGGFSRTTGNPKHAFRLFFRREYGAGNLEYPLFGAEGPNEFDKIDLKTSQNYSWSFSFNAAIGENTYVRELWSRLAQRDWDEEYTRGKYYHLYINGQYWGLFDTQERSEANFGATHFGGDADSYDTIKAESSPRSTEVTDGTIDEWKRFQCAAQDLGAPARVVRDVQNCGPAPAPMTEAQRYEAYMKLQGLNPDGTRNLSYDVDLDVDNLIKYMLVIIYTGNGDAPVSKYIGDAAVNNWFAVRKCSQPPPSMPDRVCDGELGWQFFAHDNEHTMGQPYDRDGLANDRSGPFDAAALDSLGPAGTGGQTNPQTIFEYLWNVREFRMRVADLIQEGFFNGGPLTVENGLALWQSIADDIGTYTESSPTGPLSQATITSVQGAIVAEAARWGNTTDRSPRHWGYGVERPQREWFPQRQAIVLNQLRGDGLWPVTTAPTFSQFGGEVEPGYQLTMSAPQGAIYYTTDGSDPRAVSSTGAVSISPTAISYNPVSTYATSGAALRWRVPTGAASEANWQTLGYVPDASWGTGTSGIGYDTGANENVRGFNLRVVDTSAGPTIPNIDVATDLLIDGAAAGYTIASDTMHIVPYVDLGDGGNMSDPPTLAVPGTADREQYAVRATASVRIPAGTYTVAVGSDDGFRLTIPGVNFTNVVNGNGTQSPTSLVFSAPRGHGQTLARFTLASELTTNITLDFYEAAGGDSVELSILNSGVGAHNPATFRTLRDGVFGWTFLPPSPVFSIPSTDFTPEINTDVETAMNGVNSSLYTRIPFTASNLNNIVTMFMGVQYDDGFVAYLNGTEVARRNAPGSAGTPLAFNAAATDIRRDDAPALEAESIDLTAFKNLLVNGTNVLAIQVLNAASDNPDLLFDVQLDVTFPGSPVTINESTHINARALNTNGEWSPIVRTDFTIGIPNLRVVELHYNPAEPSVAEVTACQATSPTPQADLLCMDGDEYEFLEIQNTGTEAVNLGGIHFKTGLTFTFPAGSLAPGARAVVAKNLDAFAARYGTGIVPVGAYSGTTGSGNLDNNNGEMITIEGAFGEHVQEFAYSDNWYPLTDGEGYSLVIVDPNAAADTWNTPGNWRTGFYKNGSPGSADSGAPAPQGSILINEVLPHTSALSGPRVEFHNTTASPINISGYYLTDDPQDLTQYRLPSFPDIPAGGFLVINQDQTFGSAFELSPQGGTLILQGADGPGALTGFQKQISYDGAELNVSQGPIEDSLGESTFEALATNTFGAANSGPRIGPIVVNEIMYNPAFLAGDEFIEIKNISGSAVSLAGWSFSAGVSFVFPSVSLAAGEYLLVAGMDPATFRTRNNIPASVQVVGPYTGVLDNGGEELTLAKTGDVAQTIIVDRIKYLDESPWPATPDGTGPSLSKLISITYGNDPNNWQSGIADGTPGADNQFFDESPPTIPSIMTVVATGTGTPQISLNWTTATDPQSAVSHYLVFRNNVQVGDLIAGTTFTDSTAAFDQLYTYSVAAVNTSGSASMPSPGQTIRVMSLTGAAQAATATQLRVTFSQTLDVTAAQNINNYFISNGLSVTAATVEASGTSVLLTLNSPLVPRQGYRVVVNNVNGAAAGTVMLVDSNRVFVPGVTAGMLGEYYDATQTSFNDTSTPTIEPAPDMPFGTKVGERIDGNMNFTWLASITPAFTPPLPSSAANTYGIRWTGNLLAPLTGAYTFPITFAVPPTPPPPTATYDGVRLWIDADEDGLFEDIPSERLLNAWPAVTAPVSAPINLTGGKIYKVRIDAYDDQSNFRLQFNWTHPGQLTPAQVPSSNLFAPTTLDADPPAAVGNVTLKNSSWTPAVLAAIQAAGLGIGGVTVPIGGTSPILPWSSGIDQIAVRFDEDVAVAPEDLIVSGVNVPSYSVSSVSYDYDTYTATWTLSQPIRLDRATINFAGTDDLAGNDLSGPNSATVRALAGDGDQDGDVDDADFLASRVAQFSGIGSAGYNLFLDTDTNGAINVLDWQNVLIAKGTSLPAPAPSAAPGAAPGAVVARALGARALARIEVASAETSTTALPLRTIPAGRPRLSTAGVDQSVVSELPDRSRVLRASRIPASSARRTSGVDAAFGSALDL